MPGAPRPNPEIDRWFVSEILPHEGALTRYIRRVWSKSTDIADLRQDVYLRVYQSALQEIPKLPKPFLFATARNLLSDRIRRGRIVQIDYTQDLEALNVLVDEISPERGLKAHQELQLLINALDQLPESMRRVIWLRRIEGMSQRDAAARLGMKEMTLAAYLSKGIRALARYVLGDTEKKSIEPAADVDTQDQRR
jgi:RNA polymerase sigma-70 factor (ECF subfamily)